MMTPVELLAAAQSALATMRTLLAREREALLAFDATSLSACADEKTQCMQEMWIISAQLRKEMMKESNATDESLAFEVRQYRDAMLDLRRALARNERLLSFATELTGSVRANQQPDITQYDAAGQTKAADAAMFNRRF